MPAPSLEMLVQIAHQDALFHTTLTQCNCLFVKYKDEGAFTRTRAMRECFGALKETKEKTRLPRERMATLHWLGTEEKWRECEKLCPAKCYIGSQQSALAAVNHRIMRHHGHDLSAVL